MFFEPQGGVWGGPGAQRWRLIFHGFCHPASPKELVPRTPAKPPGGLQGRFLNLWAVSGGCPQGYDGRNSLVGDFGTYLKSVKKVSGRGVPKSVRGSGVSKKVSGQIFDFCKCLQHVATVSKKCRHF